MLIKTITIETSDDLLFSKESPLLPAATELAFHTVNCSALNAEELRRESGIEVNGKKLNQVTFFGCVCFPNFSTILGTSCIGYQLQLRVTFDLVETLVHCYCFFSGCIRKSLLQSIPLSGLRLLY